MKLLDTDTFSLLAERHSNVTARLTAHRGKRGRGGFSTRHVLLESN
jgi:hypothetical protein